MQAQTTIASAVADAASPSPLVLVVDDSRMYRRMLSGSLSAWGYRTVEASSGADALRLAEVHSVDMVVSDWVMPGMTGPEFCRRFRALARDTYGYFILLTSKCETDEVAEGLDAGADEFLTKPFVANELRARLMAGERIIRMERELRDQIRLTTSAHAELSRMYDSLDRDLIEARKLQQSLVRERHRAFGNSDVSLLLRPAGHVGGDLVGFFPIAPRRIGLFAIDVSGHGVTSALMTARLSGLFSGTSADQNIAFTIDGFGGLQPRRPDAIADALNRLLLVDLKTEHYFTLLYADVDLASGAVRMVQAGHPHPAVQRLDGGIEFLGDGGLPIGLLPDATFSTFETVLAPGERLLLMSDGITECPAPDGTELGETGVVDIFQRNANVRGPAFLEALTWDLERYAGGQDWRDDVSGVLFEFGGNRQPAETVSHGSPARGTPELAIPVE